MGLDQKNAHYLLLTTLLAGANHKNHAVGGRSGCIYTRLSKKRSTRTGTVKVDPHKCFHLKYPYNSYIFKIYQKHLFLFCKTEKLKITIAIGFFQARKLTTK